jgi:type I restriction enzyme M protein
MDDSVINYNIERGKNEKLISIENGRITYNCKRKFSDNFKDPEEQVRASYFVELVLNYKYSNTQIDMEVTVPKRTPEDKADIVVYEDKECKQPYLVVECKKDRITDAEYKQAIEQAFGNANGLRAKYAVTIAGLTRTAFDIAGFKPGEREKNVIGDIPVRFGKVPKYRFTKDHPTNDIKKVSREELIRTLEKCHDTVWQGGKLAPTAAFDEVSKLLFCKLKDEKDTIEEGKEYQFQIGTHESAEEVYSRINAIYEQAKKQDAEVFTRSIEIEPKVVYQVVEHIQSINFVDTDLDTKGLAFERFMQDFFKGKMGQYFTPRKLVEFCVKMLEPGKDDLVLDPDSGSGGFLLNTLDSIRREAETKIKDPARAYAYWHDFAQKNLYGIEINDQIARVCKMNMIIHDDGHTNVISTDSLDNWDNIQSNHKSFNKDHFDIVLTNPPFGAKIKNSEKGYLDNYQLGKGRNYQKAEILFIERIIDFVKPGTGRIGMVLPDGILTNSSLQYVRDEIMKRCQILAVVSLPQFSFAHYGAGVKASLVFLRRLADNETAGKYPIFMAIAEHIGYDATGRDDPRNDLDTIHDEWKNFRANPGANGER